MKTITRACLGLFLALACLFSFAPTSEASSDVGFEVTNVELKGDTITFKGNFINHSDVYQRVLKMDVRYSLSDVDGAPLLSGLRRIDDLKVDIGGEKVPFQFTIDDSHAHEFRTDDIAVWKVSSDIEIE